MKLEPVPHGHVITDEEYTVVVSDPIAGEMTQRPFLGENAQVGLQLTHSDGRVEYIYFNTSNGGDGSEGRDGGPGFNTFVYQGTEGDPAEDDPLHFYYLFDPRDWEEPDGINER